jgi:hypothetical protein
MTKEIQMVPRLAWGLKVDYQERINFDRMRKERLERTRAGMRQRGIAAVVLTMVNLRYATGTRTPEWRYRGSDLGIVFAEHNPIVYLLHEAVVHNRNFTPWIKPENIRTIPLILPGSSKAQIQGQGRRVAGLILNDLKEKESPKRKSARGDDPSIRGAWKRPVKMSPWTTHAGHPKVDGGSLPEMAGAIAKKGESRCLPT